MTTLQQLMQNIKSNTNINLAPDRLAYGWSEVVNIEDGSPFVSVADFKSDLDYTTGGPFHKSSTFSVHVIATTTEEAERVLLEIDATLQPGSTPTPNTQNVFRTTYEVLTIQPVKDSYRYEAMAAYELEETDVT